MTGAKAPTISLRNGADIPVLGIGTSPLRGEDSVRQIRAAIEAGYRLIDTAENYRNEESVGEGIRDSGIDRDQIFLTTKFNRRWHSIDGVRQAYDASRKRLGVDYLDLLLVHWPNPDQDRYVEAVQGLQKLLESGDLRAIGVSNYKPAHLQRVLDETGITPDVNQIQLSPYSTRDDCRAYHAEHGIVTESWSPLGASSGALRNDPTIVRIAAAHHKSPTQVVLRWHVQLGLVVIPRSSNPDRIAENIEVFDFELSNEEMTSITGLNRGDAELTDSDDFGH
ncbi:MAG TPA: aldo/keto reductase [Propionibacteriaceae bacterium]|jgi:2,5-diketo-D-gluconate reductase A|nr:aldo/keto reductase [Propionibacteriaceae bacterium]